MTDTRITPRTLSRVLGGEPLAELHKQFPHIAAGFKAGGPHHPNADGHSPRSVPGPHHPLFPGLPAPPGLLAGLPTSVAIPNPSLADFNPFSSFYSPPHLPNVSTSATPPSANRPKMATPPPLEKSRPRERHHSSNDLGRENSTPPTMLRHPSLLSRGSPDFAARLREHRDQDMEEFIREQSLISGKKIFVYTTSTIALSYVEIVMIQYVCSHFDEFLNVSCKMIHCKIVMSRLSENYVSPFHFQELHVD